MSQSKRGSFAETLTNILIGYSINFVINWFILPRFGMPLTLDTNLKLGLIYTGVSIVRGYLLRRAYNRFNFFGK